MVNKRRNANKSQMVGYSESDVTATALRVEFVRRSVSERDGRERRGEGEFGEEFSFAQKFAGVRDGNTTGAEHGMLHSKPVDAQKKDGRSLAPRRDFLVAIQFVRICHAVEKLENGS